MKTPIMYFSVDEDGNPVHESEGIFERVCKTLKPEKRYFHKIEEYKNNRSLKQNRYMWGVVYEYLSKQTGYTPEEVDQIYGEMFRSYEKNGVRFVKSTKELKTNEMEDYLSDVRQHASSFHKMYIPLPNEVHWLDV